MTQYDCDVAIIGAGTAGIAAERSARAAGARTRLIDERFAGTTCATVGCMPSKLLIAAAAAAHAARRAGLFGVTTSGVTVDGAAVMRRVQAERDRFAAAAKESLSKLPPGVCIEARAKFVDANTLALDADRRLTARAIVIATGSTPAVPPVFAGVRNRVLTNESIFELRELPRSLAVIGAGPLGLELAQAFRRLGVQVRVFDESDHLAGLADRQVAAELLKILGEELPLTLGVSLQLEPRIDGLGIRWSGKAQGAQDFERVLVATGRPPKLDGLGLVASGAALNEHGVPNYDACTMQCGALPIFMAGDADHDRPVLHEASAEGAIAGRNAARFPDVTPTARYVPLSIMFTDPPVAVAGAVPRDDETDDIVGRASYQDQGRAKVFARNAGLVRIYADPDNGQLRGATLCGPAAEHSGHLLAWAIQCGMSASDMLRMPIYHPTFEEGLKPALRMICEAVRSPLEGAAAPGE